IVLAKPPIGPPDENHKYAVHDPNRPKPEGIEPAPADKPFAPPSDAIVLFDGSDTSAWKHGNGDDCKWEVKDGAMIATKGTGSIMTKENYGSVQIHLEWSAPTEIKGASQGRGNSGVFFMNKYEVQILDNYDNETYADGYAGSLYGQYPPLANPIRKPGEWNTYDIIFQRPIFGENGEMVRPARATVFFNGVCVQPQQEFYGTTSWRKRAKYSPHGDTGPIQLQDHGNPVRFRNIWIRPLPDARDGDLK
ncbi:MAG: DUF1080 domain-containing protein, partial [Rhodospirillales bacterium]|nr:DUF1080 domain-containing protein [Rhodospirillales bacterium]